MTISQKSAQQIDTEAAEWAARMDHGPLDGSQEKQFLAWLGADRRSMGAYGRMRAIALTTERARALGPDFVPAAFEPKSSFSRRGLLQWGAGIAATALIV